MTTTTALRGSTTTRAGAFIGLGVTVLSVAVLYLDHATGNLLASHISNGYPGYDSAQIGRAATTYLAYLTTLGGLGVIGWLTTIWTMARHPRVTPWLATGLLVISTTVGLFNLFVRDTSGDTGLPAVFGWVGLAPSLVGLILVVMLWRQLRGAR